MVAAALSALVLAGVCSAFLMIGQTSLRSSNASEVEAQTRRALETFGQDARRASNIRWNSAQSITLTLPAQGGARTVVSYAFDSIPGSPTFGCFYSVTGADPTSLDRLVLARGLSEFSFERFKLESSEGVASEAANDLETKQVRLRMAALRKGTSTMATSQAALSASFILRNKRVSN